MWNDVYRIPRIKTPQGDNMVVVVGNISTVDSIVHSAGHNRHCWYLLGDIQEIVVNRRSRK